MPLYIKDDANAALVAQLAKAKAISKQEAVRQAVRAELSRMAAPVPLRQRLAALRAELALPAPCGQADKAFFDALSGGL